MHAWKAWKAYADVTPVFCALAARPTLTNDWKEWRGSWICFMITSV